MNNGTPAPKIETKSVKHTFDPEERNSIGSDLARTIATARGIEAEFDQVKASYKAKTTEAEARIDNLSTSLMNGFEMRQKKCVVVYAPTERKKRFILEEDFKEFGDEGSPVLVEEMTNEDFQSELLQAESIFDNREEIELFPRTMSDFGLVVVGRFGGKWFSALRVTIGKLSLNERLDSEQPCFKQRPDAVKKAVSRVREWAKENLKEHAKGFEDSFRAVVEAHKERAE